jgi:hypothetical protein
MPADDKIIVNVRLLPEEPPTREHPHLTRFQLGTKRDATREKLALECHPGDTVAKLKQMIEGAAAREGPAAARRRSAPRRVPPPVSRPRARYRRAFLGRPDAFPPRRKLK